MTVWALIGQTSMNPKVPGVNLFVRTFSSVDAAVEAINDQPLWDLIGVASHMPDAGVVEASSAFFARVVPVDQPKYAVGHKLLYDLEIL